MAVRKKIKDVTGSRTVNSGDWPLIKKFHHVQPLSHQEIDVLVKMHERITAIPSKEIILNPGDEHRRCYIVTQGWAYRYAKLDDGSRQVINYYLPGDIISPFALFMPKANYSVASITPMRVSVFQPDSLISAFASHPKLGLLYGWMLGRDDMLIAEQVVRIGRRSAYKRTAHLLLEFFHRMQVVGLNDGNSFETPLTQDLLADTLGLSHVHMNRTLRKLQKDEVISGRLGRLTLHDVDSLIAMTGYQPRYLEYGQQLRPVVEHQQI